MTVDARSRYMHNYHQAYINLLWKNIALIVRKLPESATRIIYATEVLHGVNDNVGKRIYRLNFISAFVWNCQGSTRKITFLLSVRKYTILDVYSLQ